MRRDEVLGRLAASLGTPGRRGRRGVAVLLGWLVLMTIWGFGRAWHGGLAPVELVVGLVAGTAVAVLGWRRASRPECE